MIILTLLKLDVKLILLKIIVSSHQIQVIIVVMNQESILKSVLKLLMANVLL